MDVDFKSIEKKWQEKWEEEETFQAFDNSEKKKFYVLDMFPYPSATGLHIGHAFVFSIGDIFARFKRLQGYNVLYPIGYDAFGLPAENAAIKEEVHPEKYTNNSIINFMKQQKAMGWSYDWSRMINTSSPNYSKWDQWIFLKMLEKGIAYRKKASVNWCSKCNSVLANEQVINGKCWRHEDTNVEIKPLEQWFFKITNYAEKLLDGLEKIDWPERAKTMQRNWIGKSQGTEIQFEVNGKKWPIFTTRPDTIFGVTFMVISAQHSKLMDLVTNKQKKEVEDFLKKLKSVSEKELKNLEKEGVFTGSYAVNPVNGEKIPVYAGNFVLADYGSGMVMAVPAHDQRDFDFAKKYGIEIKQVIQGEITDKAYTGEGELMNSGEFDGMDNKKAKEEITKFLKKKKLGKKTIQYKLRDWLISRQRYWGTPIPIIYCDKCGAVPVPEKDLPVMLPTKVTFGEGNPLATNEEWIRVKCPKCNEEARRETDTMDTFVNSSWYFLRYCDPDNDKEIFDKEKVKYWMPIDQYIGGPEHITMHLIYARFYTKFLNDIKLLEFDEPVSRYFTQGIVHGSDGEKMSKSRGNVVDPLDIIKRYGADALRLFLVSLASPDKDSNWDEKGIDSTSKFLKKVFDYFKNVKIGDVNSKTESKLNKIIKEVTNQIENFKYNLAVIKVRELFNSLPEETSKDVLEKSLKLLHPFCPHITEELWEKLGNKDFISLSEWPKTEEKKINEFFDKQDEALEKLIHDILSILKIVESKGEKKEKVFVYVIPGEEDFYDINELNRRIKKEVKIFSVKDPDKYDPSNISKKARPGKPGIYLE